VDDHAFFGTENLILNLKEKLSELFRSITDLGASELFFGISITKTAGEIFFTNSLG